MEENQITCIKVSFVEHIEKIKIKSTFYNWASTQLKQKYYLSQQFFYHYYSLVRKSDSFTYKVKAGQARQCGLQDSEK